MEQRISDGLEGVVVARTRLSEVDGERGRLVVAGRSIEELAGAVGFEALAAQLLLGDAPPAGRVAHCEQVLGVGRVRAFDRLSRAALGVEDGMAALRALVGSLPSESEPLEVVAATATFAAAWARVRAGGEPVRPDPDARHAQDYLRMATGTQPDGARAAALESYLVTVTDHGMNASTFAARVVASTGSDLVSAVTAAVGALKGPLHGGAPGPVLDMLDAIGSPERAEAWLSCELAAGRRIMGMGHRIYRVRDPRASVLERAARALEAAGLAAPRLTLARAVEQASAALLATRHPDRPLQANVEFYTAVLLDAVGLDRSSFAPTFAVGRVVGWCAHVLEQRARGRLIRPQSLYDGPAPEAA